MPKHSHPILSGAQYTWILALLFILVYHDPKYAPFPGPPLLLIGHYSPLSPYPDSLTIPTNQTSDMGSPALNKAFKNADTLKKMATQAHEPITKKMLHEMSGRLYQLSVAQAQYEYINGSQSLEIMIKAAGASVPESVNEAVKNVQICRNRTLQSLEKLETNPKLSAPLKAQIVQLALDAVKKADNQYGSLLKRAL
jgi:hypothetical protein